MLGITFVLQMPDAWPGRCTVAFTIFSKARSHCVSKICNDDFVGGCNPGRSCWSHTSDGPTTSTKRRNDAPGEKQGSAAVSRSGTEDEYCEHGQDSGAGGAQWRSERCPHRRWTSGAGNRRARCRQEMALRTGIDRELGSDRL